MPDTLATGREATVLDMGQPWVLKLSALQQTSAAPAGQPSSAVAQAAVAGLPRWMTCGGQLH